MYFLALLNFLALLVVLLILRIVIRIKKKQRRLEIRLKDVRELHLPWMLRGEYRQITDFISLVDLLKPKLPLPPLRGYAISPDLALILLKLVDTRQPSLVVELGGGASTLVCAYRMREISGGRIYSFDHEEKFASITQRQLEAHELADLVEVRHAPLKSCQFNDPAGNTLEWYDERELNKLPDNIDLLIVDGPPSRINSWIRYPALPALYKKLSPTCAIVLDDADREGETAISQRWLEEFPDFSIIRETTEKGTTILFRDS